MDSSGSLHPSRQLLWRCCYIFGAEILIDVTKHAVLAKLNDIRPNVYQRFMKVAAAPATSSGNAPEHNMPCSTGYSKQAEGPHSCLASARRGSCGVLSVSGAQCGACQIVHAMLEAWQACYYGCSPGHCDYAAMPMPALVAM